MKNPQYGGGCTSDMDNVQSFLALGFVTERTYTVKSSEGEGKDQCRISTWGYDCKPNNIVWPNAKLALEFRSCKE